MKKITIKQQIKNQLYYIGITDNHELVEETLTSPINRDFKGALNNGNVKCVSKIIDDWANSSKYLDRDDILNICFKMYLNLDNENEAIESYFNREL